MQASNINLMAPNEYSVEAQALERRRKLAELMQQQSLEPLQAPPSSGGWAVPMSPLAPLAKMLQGYAGGRGQTQADERAKALAARIRGDTAGTLERFQQKMMGTPAQTTGELGTVDELNTPAQAPDMRGAYVELMGSQNPALQQAALAAMLKSNDPFTLSEGASRFAPGGQLLAQNPKQRPLHFGNTGGAIQPMNPMTGAPVGTPTPTTMTPAQRATHEENKGWGEPYQLGGAMVRKNAITGKVEQVVSRPPQTHVYSPPAVTVTELQDPNDSNATIKVDARTGKVLGKGPKLTDTGKLENKRQFNMQGIGAIIQRADDLLSGQERDPSGVSRPVPTPTGSGIGAAYDYAAGVLGASPSGSVQAQQMKAIGGALVTKMPRMEGPQSDRDVALYKEMAAQIGDATVPISRRKAALDTVKQLWSKYERLNPDAFQDRRTGGANVVDFNSLPTGR